MLRSYRYVNGGGYYQWMKAEGGYEAEMRSWSSATSPLTRNSGIYISWFNYIRYRVLLLAISPHSPRNNFNLWEILGYQYSTTKLSLVLVFLAAQLHIHFLYIPISLYRLKGFYLVETLLSLVGKPVHLSNT